MKGRQTPIPSVSWVTSKSRSNMLWMRGENPKQFDKCLFPKSSSIYRNSCASGFKGPARHAFDKGEDSARPDFGTVSQAATALDAFQEEFLLICGVSGASGIAYGPIRLKTGHLGPIFQALPQKKAVEGADPGPDAPRTRSHHLQIDTTPSCHCRKLGASVRKAKTSAGSLRMETSSLHLDHVASSSFLSSLLPSILSFDTGRRHFPRR